MSEAADFQDLIRRVRAGDDVAAAELVRGYESAIRRAVRIRLGDARLKRLLDATDICQSVLGSFFVRAALGQYELETPQQLVRLLETMARNKLADQARKQAAAARNHRIDPADGAAKQVLDPASSPSQQAARKELLTEFRARLTEEERQLAAERGQGREWVEIAADRGGSPAALRKKLARAINRVSRELGLEG